MSSIGVMKGRAILHFAVLQEFQQLILSSVPIIHFGKTLAVILITLYLIKEKDVQEQINTVFINSISWCNTKGIELPQKHQVSVRM